MSDLPPDQPADNSDTNVDTIQTTRKRKHAQLREKQAAMETNLSELKKLVEQQQEKIKKLEKRARDYKETADRLDDAILEVNERMDEIEETIIDTDEYNTDEDEDEGDDEPLYKRPRRKTAKYGKGSTAASSEDEEDGDRPSIIVLNAEESAELEEHEAEKDTSHIGAIVKKVLQRADPKSYVTAYCKEKKMSKRETGELVSQSEQFVKLNNNINGEKDQTDLDHFLISPESIRKDIVNSLSYIKSEHTHDKPYKFRILTSAMENYAKNIAIYKSNQLQESEPGTGEYYKVKNWLDNLLAIPWGEYKSLQVEPAEVGQYLANARSTMDQVIFGQSETKDVIIQIISKMIANPQKSGNVFAVFGPPGVGKTTIIKDGMSKALNLPFAFLSLGGATDSSFLDGHGYTYEGSTPGKIVEMLKKTKCMNPIFYFDELDKVSDTRKGEEVANLLIHLTDPSQNTLFQDKYLGNINIDLSKAIFVFSFNDITKVNPILLDRMELIYVNGFTLAEKLTITRDYLLPELLSTYCLYTDNRVDVEFTDDNLSYIISYNNLAALQQEEQGVRQIKRRIEKICSQLNIVKLTKDTVKDAKHKIHSVIDEIPELKSSDWPLKLTNQLIDKMLKNKGHILSTRPPIGMYS